MQLTIATYGKIIKYAMRNYSAMPEYAMGIYSALPMYANTPHPCACLCPSGAAHHLGVSPSLFLLTDIY